MIIRQNTVAYFYDTARHTRYNASIRQQPDKKEVKICKQWYHYTALAAPAELVLP